MNMALKITDVDIGGLFANDENNSKNYVNNTKK
jgi:hypothetical protein